MGIDQPALEPSVPDQPAPDQPAPDTPVPDQPPSGHAPPEQQLPERAADTQDAAPVIGQSAPAGAPVARRGAQSDAAGPERRPGAGVTVGKIVEVTVTTVREREVEVRMLDGSVGVIPSSEFDEAVSSGDVIKAALLAREDPKQRAVLSASWARKQLAWERIEAAHAERTPVLGTVSSSIKGGAAIDVGVRAFLPTSLLGDAGGSGLAALVGTEIEVLVVEVDRDADRIVVSIRDLERRRRRAKEKEMLASLVPGSRVTGRVVSTADYGAVVDLGGTRGLIHRSELTWGRLERVEDVVQVGSEVEAVVLDVNRSKRRIGLSLRATAPDPLEQVETGAIESATVVRVVEYGVFARLDETGAEGLVHISELSDVPGYRPDQLVTPGEQLMVKVMGVDHKKRRLALSVRRVLVDD